MTGWREMLQEAVELEEAAPAETAPPTQTVELRPSVDPEIVDRIRGLKTRQPPRLEAYCQSTWPRVVNDANRLIDEGWAAQAFELGWDAFDLFGLSTPDTYDFEGLAVWLKGRRLVLLDETMAIARDQVGRFFFNRGAHAHGGDARAKPVLLWQFGRQVGRLA